MATSEHDDELKNVSLPSGASLQVYKQEVKYFQDRSKLYLTHNVFSNVSDLQDLDRILLLELLVWRYSNWVARQRDYWDEPVDEAGLNKQVKDASGELRATKASLGLDKASRDKARGEDSIATYIENLGIRAKSFGYMRNRQQAKSIELGMELIARLTLHDNCHPDEQAELHCRNEDIVSWIRDVYRPAFEKVDADFRDGQQRMWIRTQ